MKSMYTVRIPPDLSKEVEKVAKYEHVGVSDLIRESLTRYVAVKRFRTLREKALKKAAARGIFTDEDVFDIVS